MAGQYPAVFDQILSNAGTTEMSCNWFWHGSNGNDLIEVRNRNNMASSGSWIRRRHQFWPHVYGIVYNQVHIEEARSQNFPVPTEWVSQPYLQIMRNQITAAQFVNTGLFANLNFNSQISHQYIGFS